LEIGAKIFEARLEDLDVNDGVLYVKGSPDRRLVIPEVFKAHFGYPVGCLFGSYDLQISGGLDPRTGKGKATAFFFLSACAAEVEVDPDTGKVNIERVVTAVDVGRAINPRQCALQNEGSMIMAVGGALYEEMLFENGQPINSTFLDYMPASMEDHPREFRSILVETPHPEGPMGAKGVGEAAMGPVEPAIGNAIANALGGIRIRDLPLKPERVLAAIQKYV
jgi:CO/xanthine dehydrogenase Mo-binding subunit